MVDMCTKRGISPSLVTPMDILKDAWRHFQQRFGDQNCLFSQEVGPSPTECGENTGTGL